MLDFDGDAPRPCPRCEPTRSAADYADPEHPVIRKQQALDQAAAELAAAAGPALPGTLVVRAYECGKPRCRCHTSPAARHGPYAEWTRKIGGKTVTRRLTPEQLAAWQRLFDNAKKLRALLAELQELTLAIIEASDSPPP